MQARAFRNRACSAESGTGRILTRHQVQDYSALGAAFDAQDEVGRVALVTAHAEDGVTHTRVVALTTADPRSSAGFDRVGFDR